MLLRPRRITSERVAEIATPKCRPISTGHRARTGRPDAGCAARLPGRPARQPSRGEKDVDAVPQLQLAARYQDIAKRLGELAQRTVAWAKEGIAGLPLAWWYTVLPIRLMGA